MREFLLFTEESAYKTPVTPTTGATGTLWNNVSTAANFNSFYGRLDTGDSFTMRARPVMVTVPFGGGSNIPAFTVSDKFECKGRYVTKLYAGPFTKFLFLWASQQINSLNYIAPATIGSGWADSEAPGNLGSVTILHAIQRPQDGSYKCQQYSGVKVESWDLTMSQDSQIATLTMNLTGASASGNPYDGTVDPTASAAAGAAPIWGSGSTATTWGPPATNNLPINPFLFVNCSQQTALGSGATGTAVLGSGATAGQVVSITLGVGGSAYTLPPSVVLTGGGGYGATAIATLSSGAVTGYIVTSGGASYGTVPTVTTYPVPASGLYIGSERTTFQSVHLSSNNSLMSRYWANRFVQFIEFCGRVTKLEVQNFYQPTSSSPDDRYTMESLANQTVNFGFNNGQHSVLFTMNTNNIIETVSDSLPLADIYTQTLGITSQWDPNYTQADVALAADLQLSFT